MKVCIKHRESPAKGYHLCPGCEVEWLNRKVEAQSRALEAARERVKAIRGRLDGETMQALKDARRECWDDIVNMHLDYAVPWVECAVELLDELTAQIEAQKENGHE